jgi:hypothetical protein
MTAAEEEESSLKVLMDDLLELLGDNTNPKVTENALKQGLLPALRSPPHVAYLEQHAMHKIVKILIDMISSLSETTSKLALQSLIELSSSKEQEDEDKLLEDFVIGGAHEGFIKEMIHCGVIDKLMNTMMVLKNKYSQNKKNEDLSERLNLCAILLNNVTTQSYGARKLLQIKSVEDSLYEVKNKIDTEDEVEEDSEEDDDEKKDQWGKAYYIFKLIEWFTVYDDAKFSKWIPNILTNVTNIGDGRELLLTNDHDSVIGGDKFLLQDLIGTDNANSIIWDQDPLKRSGALKAVRNCLFEKREHHKIVAQTPLVDIVLNRLVARKESTKEFVEDKISLRRLLSEVVLILTTSAEGADALSTEERFRKIEDVIENDTDPEKKVTKNCESTIERIKRRYAEKSGMQIGEGEFVRLQPVDDDETGDNIVTVNEAQPHEQAEEEEEMQEDFSSIIDSDEQSNKVVIHSNNNSN